MCCGKIGQGRSRHNTNILRSVVPFVKNTSMTPMERFCAPAIYRPTYTSPIATSIHPCFYGIPTPKTVPFSSDPLSALTPYPPYP